MKLNNWTILPVLLMSAGLVTACGSSDNSSEAREKQIEAYAKKHGLNVDVEVSGAGKNEQVVINRNVGGVQQKIGKNLDLPDDFPKDVPAYPGMSIHAANKMGVAYMLGASSMDDPAKIEAFYKQEMSSQGWTAQGASNPLPNMFGDRYTKGKRSANVTIARNNPGLPHQVSVVVTNPPAGQ